MNKQDVYDIIQLLDEHFQSHGLEIRNNIFFRFEWSDSDSDSDWFDYDDKNLWLTTNDNDEEIYQDDVNDNLELQILNQKFYTKDSLSQRLEKYSIVSDFFFKCVKLLQQEFKVDDEYYQDEIRDGILEIRIINTEKTNERIQIKKFNQFK
jgi:hypothetical protein